MTKRSRARALALAALSAIAVWLALPATAAAQDARPNVVAFLPASALRGDTLRSVTPTVVVQASGFSTVGPLHIVLQIDVSPRFDSPSARDYEVAVDTRDVAATLSPPRALQEDQLVYYRATVTDVNGASASSAVSGPVRVPRWVTLGPPPTVVGQPVRTRAPRFIWHSPAVNEPPGPWQYTIRITNLARKTTTTTNVGTDTTFVPTRDLEPNAAYTWSLEARLVGQATTVVSPVTFFVEDAAVPVLTTSLYQPFPSPFPNAVTDRACVWFDLRADAAVALDVIDLRGLHVRRLLPNSDMPSTLPAGRYGRGRVDLNEGCDRRVAWDGTDDRGRSVPEGVYIFVFRAGGTSLSRKVLFRGPS